MLRFDRFTERAQEAAQRAAEIIQRYRHNQIDTEHILLALIEQPGGVIPQILEKLSVSPEALTERLDATLRASPKANIFGGGAGQIFITPRVKRIIDLANEEANRLKDEYISTEHIFLVILTERNTRQLTIYNLEKIKRYIYLKNGAMYSVLVLGFVMLAHGYGLHIPEWLAPLATIVIVGYFFWKSWKHARAAGP